MSKIKVSDQIIFGYSKKGPDPPLMFSEINLPLFFTIVGINFGIYWNYSNLPSHVFFREH